MSFYFPLRLGLKHHATATRREEKDGHPKPKVYETWREGIDRSLTGCEESPESQVLQAICRSAPTNRLAFVLGEPGAGKTTLIEDWFRRLARETATDEPIGSKLPVLVRLRSVPSATWQKALGGDLANALWEHARAERTILDTEDGLGHYPAILYTLTSAQARVFSPVWLLDGLDELPQSVIGDLSFYQKLICLPGQKVVSSRIAVYQSLREVTERCKWRDYEILPLRHEDQQGFLSQALALTGNQDADSRSKALAAEIRSNSSVSLLGGNPLMLRLMAELATDGESLILPASRAKFYEKSIGRLWHRKLRDDPGVLRKRDGRDRFLTQQAAAMRLHALRANMPELDEDLERGLRNSGLIRVNDVEGEFEFLHLTFQEYYLARYLKAAGLTAALHEYWADARYEETLGLLVSILFEEKQYRQIEEGIGWLVRYGEDTHARDPRTLWSLGRSPLRTALSSISRAGITLRLKELEALLELLGHNLVKAPRGLRLQVMKLAAARTLRTPPELLSRLATDEDSYVRQGVARNASTPPEVLSRLAADEDSDVRWGLAGNASTPPEVLSRLATDEDSDVRWRVAGNASTPPELLSRLATGEESYVRQRVAGNASIPPEVLSRLATGEDRDVRQGVAGNASTPPEVLSRLTADEDSGVRQGVAGNANTPPELLSRLAADEDSYVRQGVAGNASTPPELLSRLAADEDRCVRWGVAGYASTPPEVLSRLATDEYSDVRWGVAGNASTPPELLSRLAADEDRDVRQGVAGNASTPPEVLSRLATDEYRGVRQGVAGNANTPPELLSRLAADEDSYGRKGVAGNASTPPEVLSRLAADEDSGVRWGVAGNANLVLEDLL